MPGLGALTPSFASGALPETGAAAASPGHRTTFHELLSELNPLQYLPVVGPIYRAVTGDTIPESARLVGSFVVSGLLGGPMGMALNVAALVAEKAIGIDPEKIEQRILASLGIGRHDATALATTGPIDGPAPSQSATVVAAPVVADPVAADSATPTPVAWSPTQLAAYGVTTTSAGVLTQGALQGSDVLNAVELARLGPSVELTRYAAGASTPNG